MVLTSTREAHTMVQWRGSRSSRFDEPSGVAEEANDEGEESSRGMNIKGNLQVNKGSCGLLYRRTQQAFNWFQFMSLPLAAPSRHGCEMVRNKKRKIEGKDAFRSFKVIEGFSTLPGNPKKQEMN